MNFSASDLCQIIDSCRKNNVITFKMEGIEFVLAPKPEKHQFSATQSLWKRPPAGGLSAIDSEFEQAESRTLHSDEATIRHDQVEDLILTDPEEYERRLMSGDLKDEVTLDS